MTLKPPSSIFIRVFFLFGLLVLAITLFFAFMVIPLQKEAFNQIMFTQAETISRSIIQASSDAIIKRDYSFIVEHNVDVLKNNDSILYVLVSPKKGEKVLINHKNWHMLKTIGEPLQALEANTITKKILSYDNNPNVYHFVYPVVFSGIEWGWLHIGFSTEKYNASVKNMYQQFIYIVGMAFALILVVGYFFSRWISLPVTQLSQLASQVANGNLKVRATLNRRDEIGILSNSFNAMVDSLLESKNQLQNYNQALEREVESRTHELAELNKSLDNKIQVEVAKGKRQEALLVHQSRSAAMGDMIGSIAHQWRQPLNALGLVQQNLKLRYQTGRLDAQFMAASMDKSERLIQKMSSTIDDFRNFFKPNKSIERFNIKQLILSTTELVEAQFKSHNIKFTLDCSDDLNIMGFPGEFSQVVLNLMTNAKDILIDRNIAEPVIAITALALENNQLQVIVKDNAGGIPPAIFEKIYDPYFTTKEEGKGTGIGLYMSKIIIENNMKGTLNAFNDNQGANFVITLTIAP